MKKTFITTLLLFLPATCWAAESFPTGSVFWQMLWALLIVLGLILVLYALAKKQFGLGKFQTGTIKVLETRYIMPKTALALIEVRGKELLVGVGTGRVELIADLSGAESPTKDFDTILAEEEEK